MDLEQAIKQLLKTEVTMKVNAVLRRKCQFAPLATVLDFDLPDDASQEEMERLAAIDLVREAELYVELEPITDKKPHGNTRLD